VDRRVIADWLTLGRSAIRRGHNDPLRIAALVSRKTRLPIEEVLRRLTTPAVSDDEAVTWFG
jgi:hypothetical protein